MNDMTTNLDTYAERSVLDASKYGYVPTNSVAIGYYFNDREVIAAVSPLEAALDKADTYVAEVQDTCLKVGASGFFSVVFCDPWYSADDADKVKRAFYERGVEQTTYYVTDDTLFRLDGTEVARIDFGDTPRGVESLRPVLDPYEGELDLDDFTHELIDKAIHGRKMSPKECALLAHKLDSDISYRDKFMSWMILVNDSPEIIPLIDVNRVMEAKICPAPDIVQRLLNLSEVAIHARAGNEAASILSVLSFLYFYTGMGAHARVNAEVAIGQREDIRLAHIVMELITNRIPPAWVMDLIREEE